MELSKDAQNLIDINERWRKGLEEKKTGTIHVDEAASRVASFYEKIRGIIDWKEEHLLRRNATERALKRRVFANFDIINGEIDETPIEAEPLVLELIRGGHFPNDTIKESKIEEVQIAINKYLFILKKYKEENLRFYNFLFSIAACEIEEILIPSIKERALINYMFLAMKRKIVLNQGVIAINPITKEEENIQIYIAVQRALFNLDNPVISYHLLNYKYPNWKNLNKKELEEIREKIHSIKEMLLASLEHPLGDKFYRVCKKYNTVYLIIGDIIKSNPLQIREEIENPEKLETMIRKSYNERFKTLKSRMRRAAFYSTLSIFLTNIVVLLAIEIPLTKIIGIFNPYAIIIDIFVPTFLMAFLVLTIKLPPKENLDIVISEVIKAVYKKEKEDIYEIKFFKKRGAFFGAIIDLVYFVIFILIVGLIFYGLYKISFPPFSYIIFIIFLSLIAFAGAKIKERAKELHMIEEKEQLYFVFLDSLSAPIIHLGKWLASKWERYNVISVFFSALIDMPFMLFIEFVEQWRYFIKEKKEKIY